EIEESGENAGYWKPQETDGDTVTVINHSNVGLKVSVAYTPSESNGVTGSIENSTFDVAMPVVGSDYDSAPKGSAKVVLDNASVPASWSNEGATTIGSVTVTLESIIIIDATSITGNELNGILMDVLSNGTTDISVTLAADAGEEMFTGIRNALLDSAVADGSINLTLTGVKWIPYSAFEEVKELKSVSLPDAEVIDSSSFYGCSYLQVINLPKAVTIYADAFYQCDLRSVVLPEVTKLGARAFESNVNLTEFSAPKATAVYLGHSSDSTWKNCTSLKTLVLSAAGLKLYDTYQGDLTTTNINLTLNSDQKDNVTVHADGTATWTTTSASTGNPVLSYTFNSITFAD
ncbi:MAG: leucine-rich repeat domain-containing protein, partial [Clostridia bacterium]|nr:leucine-rich repeat domain-containing protein [Clostridia bacterium]